MAVADGVKPRIVGLLNHGRFAEALPLLVKACKAHTRDSGLWLMLGVAQGALGRYAEAESSLKKSLKLSPRVAEACYYLGNAQFAGNKPVKALESFRKAVALKPAYPEAWQAMARICQQTGQPEKAAEHYLKAIEITPSDPELHAGLALSWKAAGRTQSALESFSEALRLQPDNAVTWFNLGNLHHGHRDLAAAESCYRKAMAAKPDWVDAQLSLGRTLLLQGKVRQALDCCRHAEKLHPGNEAITAMEASMREKLGDLEGASACVQPLIAAETGDVTALVTYAKLASHLGNHGEIIQLLEHRLASSGYDRDDTRKLHFALADTFNAIGEYDRAFVHYQQGNQLKASRFDPREWSKTVDTFIGFFTSGRLAAAGCATESSRLPVFIVGMPRTGSTLLERMLDLHPAVFGAGELPDMKNLAVSLQALTGASDAYPLCLTALNLPLADEVARSHLQRLAGLSADAQRVIDKMPGNYLHLGLIQILFPGASVLHTLRDPVDTCFSCFTRDLGGGASFSADLSALGRFYREYRRLMAHWEAVLSLPVHPVFYETLVSDTERVVKEAVAFCGLPWDSRCLDFAGDGRVVNTPSYGQVRKPLYTSSIMKWKHYEKHLGPLLDALDE